MIHSGMIQVERSWILSGIILQIKPNGATAKAMKGL
jgi:hypothetical protein